MSLRRLQLLGALLALAAVTSAGLHPAPAHAVTASGQVASDRAQLDRALTRLKASKVRVARVQARLAQTSAHLDAVIEREDHLQTQLSGRVKSMYTTGETPFLAVLMNARTYEDFADSWALLGRVNRHDAGLLRELARAREAASRTADELMRLQTQVAKDMNAEQREVARSRAELAASSAALVLYQQRARVKATTESTPRKRSTRSLVHKDSAAERSGAGAWKNAVASHYGRNFSGRGASGERIGPYSMMVAHRTLPFGTLIEFRYNGKRAVARVADRGPYGHGRTFNLGPGVIRVLGFSGVHSVQYRVIGR